MMNPDGTQQVRLTNHRADDLNPVCSPTGEEILFVSDRGGERDLYIMRADGGGERPCFAQHPHIEILPPGPLMEKKLLICQLDRDPTKQRIVYTARADGTSVTRVVEIMEKAVC